MSDDRPPALLFVSLDGDALRGILAWVAESADMPERRRRAEAAKAAIAASLDLDLSRIGAARA